MAYFKLFAVKPRGHRRQRVYGYIVDYKDLFKSLKNQLRLYRSFDDYDSSDVDVVEKQIDRK
jgi:hypothetical protein